MTADYEQSWKTAYPDRRAEARETRNGILANPNNISALDVSDEERQRIYEERWATGGTTFMASFNDLIFNQAANDTAADFVRGKIRAMVKDPRTAELLAPRDHPIGTKRICVDTDYYLTYNRDNVHLVDVRNAPIECLTETGLRTGGVDYELDAIVFATGFDAMTGTLVSVDIAGTGGQTLKQKWADGPRTYLGVMTAGFPNLFMVTGPGSPSVLSNMMVSIEQHVDWIIDCLAWLRSRQLKQPKTTGWRTSTRWPTRPCTPRRRPGTWARISPASQGSSCPISVASARTAASVTRRPRRDTTGSAWPARNRPPPPPNKTRLPPTAR